MPRQREKDEASGAGWQMCEKVLPDEGQEAGRGQLPQSLLDHSMCDGNH